MSVDRVSDSELNALVDGELDAARQAEIEDWLADNPEDARRVARYRAQNAGLHALYDDILHEDIPPETLAAFGARRSGIPPWAAIAAAVVLFIVGAAGGWGLRGMDTDTDAGNQVVASAPIDTQELIVRAAMAHLVSSEDDMHKPASGRLGDMDEYITDRMGKPVRVPRLDSFGYRLLGSRVLPDTAGPAAQFVFADDTGKKVSLYVRGEQANGVDITYALADDLSMFYWNDSDRSYAMVADVEDEAGREALLTAAKAVYGQLSK